MKRTLPITIITITSEKIFAVLLSSQFNTVNNDNTRIEIASPIVTRNSALYLFSYLCLAVHKLKAGNTKKDDNINITSVTGN